MDKVQTISRRAAILGSAVSTAALALPVVAAATTEPAANIEDLAIAFRDAAMALDPRINSCWLGYDELAKGPRDMRVMHVYFGRAARAFVSPAQPRPDTITALFAEWQDERVDRRGETEAQSDARHARYLALQDKITSARPRTVREFAMQFVVETDDGDSEYRPEFYARLRYIATEA